MYPCLSSFQSESRYSRLKLSTPARLVLQKRLVGDHASLRHFHVSQQQTRTKPGDRNGGRLASRGALSVPDKVPILYIF